MTYAGILGLPSWLVVGLLLGFAGSVLVAGAFLAADRVVPGAERERRRESGDSRRRREFRAYLDAIGEEFTEEYRVEGHPVAFYLPERDVAITFDPRAYYRIDRTPTHAILAEHEMPGAMLGDRLPFETPDVGFGDGATETTAAPADAARPAHDAFAELGVSAGASAEEVRRAYRERVKEVHPDQGGDEDEFRRVREAYTTAVAHATD